MRRWPINTKQTTKYKMAASKRLHSVAIIKLQAYLGRCKFDDGGTKMKAKLALTLVLSLGMALLTACGKSANEPAASQPSAPQPASPAASAEAPSQAPEAANIKGKITVMTNRTDLVDTKLKEYADQFIAKYPEVTGVEFEGIKDYEKTLKIRMASKELADVVMVPTGISNDDIVRYFAPLDDLGLNDSILFAETRNIDGKQYGITIGAKALGIVYNKKAFEKAGITELPMTLDAFYEACEKLKAAGIIPFATNFKEKWPLSSFKNLGVVTAGDVQYLNDMRLDDAPFKVDSPIGQATSILKTITDRGYAEPDLMSTNWEASKKEIASGSMAMYMLGNWVIPQILENGGVDEEIGFIPMPVDNTGVPKGYVSEDFSYTVNKDSGNIETAKAFVQFMIAETDYDEYSGLLPVLKGKDAKLSQVQEFMAYNPQLYEAAPNHTDTVAITNGAQIDWASLFQEAVMSDDLQKLFDGYNKKWADAKKELGL